ncbi:MAG: hypothetical protein KAY24_19310 [Candidatus Eisenbacteria sp.]|nr:hypothetical protein [Candidatus Eisenbacteria bacterium]
MTFRHALAVLAIAVMPACFAAQSVEPEYVAFSLRVAEQHLRTGADDAVGIRRLADITLLHGMVHDNESQDVIIVGERGTKDSPAMLDDLVVALRARYVHKSWPEVSLEPTKNSPQTGKHKVMMKAGIEQTRFGLDLLRADVILKKMALGGISLSGLASYFDLCVASAVHHPDEFDYGLASRFWFVLPESSAAPSINLRARTYAARRLPITVRTEVGLVNGSSGAGRAELVDVEGGAFAAELTKRFPDLKFPELLRLDTLFDEVAIARGIEKLVEADEIAFWLHHYDVPEVSTPENFDIISRESDRAKLTLEGGVRLKQVLRKLRYGEAVGLRDAVLLSRPDSNTLAWRVPIGEWRALRSGEGRAEAIPHEYVAVPGKGLGCYLTRHNSETYSGVSMRMSVDEGSIRDDATGELTPTRERSIEARPSPQSLSWPVKKD